MNEILDHRMMKAINDAKLTLTLEFPDGRKIELFSPDELLNETVETGKKIWILTPQGLAIKTTYVCIEDDNGEFVLYLSPDGEKIIPCRLTDIRAWAYDEP